MINSVVTMIADGKRTLTLKDRYAVERGDDDDSSSSSSSDGNGGIEEASIREANQMLLESGKLISGSERVKIARFESGIRGVAATKRARKGDLLCSVSLDECFTLDAAKECLPVQEGGACSGLGDIELLALHLLVERSKGPESRHYEHIMSMPKTFDAVIFWKNRDLAQLKGSPLLSRAIALRRQAAEDFTKMVSKIIEKEDGMHFVASIPLTMPAYYWAVTAVQSRYMDFAHPQGGRIRRIRIGCPFLDMFNHDRCVDVNHTLSVEDRTVSVFACRELERGDEVCINYGINAPSEKLLFFYGFVDCKGVSFEVTVPSVNAHLVDQDDAAREKILERVGGPAASPRFELTQSDPLPTALLQAIRIRELEPYDLDDIKNETEDGNAIMSALLDGKSPNKRIELCAHEVLSMFFKRLLDQYPTTLESDESELANVRSGKTLMPRRHRVALMQRIEEKKILQSAAKKLIVA